MKNTETPTTTQAAAFAETGATGAPGKAARTRKASTKKAAARGRKGARRAVTKKLTAKKPARAAVPRGFSKKAIVIDLLKAKGGASLAEIMAKTNWMAHSVRGFVSGTIRKRMGLKVESAKNDAGDRCYLIVGK